jgi:DNA-binding CsgD family transcriptional regulator
VRERLRAGRGSGASATDRELAVVAAVIAAGSEKAAAHRLGLSHSTVKHHLANARSKVGATTTAQLVWILTERLPEPEDAGPVPLRSLRAEACWPSEARPGSDRRRRAGRFRRG